MSKSIRIRTTPNGDDKYIKVELKQDFDLLEILSLKIKQSDIYGDFCADHGVVAGRVIINNGFGVPNVKVSIFIPKESDDTLLDKLYPYTSPTPDQKNVNGIRYNLLPDTQQTLDHTPVGTFPSKLSLLDDKTSLEIYERYYKYTTTTNEAGDFILFGVPTGNQTLHYDMDISDIGFISARPYELIEQGFSKELFESPFKFKSGRNLDSLTQIISQNIPVLVEPFWCDDLSTGRVIGITRQDISVDALELIPTAMFFGSVISDDEKDSVNKNCRPRKKMGQMDEMITSTGNIEAIYRTPDGDIDKYEIEENIIDENGNWSIQLPMNLRKVVTDEFGNLVPSPDGIKGIATEADYRFRISMDATSQDKRLRQRANYLVPNMTGNYTFESFEANELSNGNPYKINEQLSTFTQNTPYSADTTNQYNYLEDFYTFRWKKVYSVKQYIGRYQSLKRDKSRAFTGIKDITNGGAGVNKFPSNRLFTKVNFIYRIICEVLTFIGVIIGFINGILNIINGLITSICEVKIPCGFELVYCFRAGISICNQNYKDECATVGCNGGTPSSCGKCRCTDSGDPPNFRPAGSGCGGDKVPYFSLDLKYKCLLSKLLCKKCTNVCDPNIQHSCCRTDSSSTDRKYNCPDNKCGVSQNDDCCGSCCGKIKLIALNCSEETNTGPFRPSLIKSPFASDICNETFVGLGSCKNCGGRSTPQIKDWVACKLEGLANALNMLQFDFYNDWVSGTLYFPLVKRKYKVRKRKKGQGQVRKDKFCDYDCAPEYQDPATYKKYRIKIKNNTGFLNGATDAVIEVGGCKATLKPNYKYITQWYGVYGANATQAQAEALEAAKNSLTFKGVDGNLNGCILKYSDSAVETAVQNNSLLTVDEQDKDFPGPHGKPKYIKAEDPITGLETWENVGGHAHHQNKCNTVYRVENGVYFRDTIGCNPTQDPNAPNNDDFIVEDGEPEDGSFGGATNNSCPSTSCGSSCKPGVKACNSNCKCDSLTSSYNDNNVKHGIIKYSGGKIYYASIIKKGDVVFNETTNGETYKANLLFPTDIVEMGSSVYCDIDDVPFVIGDLEPTTFAVSEESLKYDIDSSTNPQVVNSVEDKDGVVNLRAYVEFDCQNANCVNTTASIIQSQVGVDLLDTNDLGMEIQNCFTYFNHDNEVRDYFCRRFTTFKNKNLEVNYMRPGSNEFDNLYTEYNTITLNGGGIDFDIDGQIIPNTINDGDSFLSGDRCGLKENSQYFYGMSYGSNTNTLLSFPTQSNIDSKTTPNTNGVKYSTSQTPYYHYFGLVPGKTALHKLVSNYFADKINEVTLQGLGNNEKAAENTYNQPNFRNVTQNQFTVLKTCLGEAQIAQASQIDSNGTSSPNSGNSNSGSFGAGIGGNILNNFNNNVNNGSGSFGTGVGAGNVSPPPPLNYVDIDNGSVTEVSISCLDAATGINQKTGTITVNSTPSYLKLEVDGGSTTSTTPQTAGTYYLKIFNPNGFYTPGEPEVVIEDMFGTNPTTYTNPINNNVDKGDNKYFNVVFNNTGTYEYTLEWNCFQGSSFSNVKITTN